MDMTKHKTFLVRANQIQRLPEPDQRYYKEKLIREFVAEMGEETREDVLQFVRWFFDEETNQLISDATRPDAIYPDGTVVESLPTNRALSRSRRLKWGIIQEESIKREDALDSLSPSPNPLLGEVEIIDGEGTE